MRRLLLTTFFSITVMFGHSQITASIGNGKSEPGKFRKFKLHAYPSLSTKKTKSNFDIPSDKYKTFFDFVGTGDLQKAVSNGAPINANTGAGIIFERYRGEGLLIQSLEIEASINIASTTDTVLGKYEKINGVNTLTNSRDFGAFLLYPVTGKQSFYQNTLVYFGYPGKFRPWAKVFSGFNIRFAASNSVWGYNLTGNTTDVSQINVGAFLLRAGLFHEFLPDGHRRNEDGRAKYSLFLGFNYSLRALVGDIGADKNRDLRKHFFGTDKTGFHGTEINMGFRLNNLRLEFAMPFLNKSQQIPGLTNGQFLFTIRFIGGFGLEINQKPAVTNKSADS